MNYSHSLVFGLCCDREETGKKRKKSIKLKNNKATTVVEGISPTSILPSERCVLNPLVFFAQIPAVRVRLHVAKIESTIKTKPDEARAVVR